MSISIHALREEGDAGWSLIGRPQGLFLSTPSARRATSAAGRASFSRRDFYPRPPRGGRLKRPRSPISARVFLSTPSARRATPSTPSSSTSAAQFLSTPSARRATPAALVLSRVGAISIHALREEGDHPEGILPDSRADFYPRPPRGGRPVYLYQAQLHYQFLSTPSARRATGDGRTQRPAGCNFYPRPPRGGRLNLTPLLFNLKVFLSTPSARRATLCSRCATPRLWISIHALREEGDRHQTQKALHQHQFLSTPSARRATRSA